MMNKKQREKCKDSQTDNVVAGPSQPSGVLVSKLKHCLGQRVWKSAVYLLKVLIFNLKFVKK